MNTVVIIDDEESMTALLAGHFKKQGFLAWTANNYQEAMSGIMNNPDIILGIYDSEIDPEAVSVEEAKQIVNGERSFVSHMGRSASPSTSLYVLKGNTSYRSDAFSGSGWRFSNYYFKPASGTGEYLLWSSFIDGGRVGSYDDACATLNGTLSGMELPVNTAKYYRNAGGQQYFTYNPIKGTYYVVSNPV